MTELIFKEEVYAIVGAAFEVRKEMGEGFLEAVYQEALEKEFSQKGIPFDAQKPLRIKYKDDWLKKEYVTDFVCYSKIIVELKAIDRLSGNEQAQILNYLRAAGLRVGLLINFGAPSKLEWKRFVM